ncbi:MAG: sulfatase-like hydrolase/transferase, partial [Planctomycetaceae bacterium]
ADDMGYECVRANGGTSYQTPNLDKLAANGLRFTNCHSQPICTPSRVQIMTGIYNNRNYIEFGLLDPKATTFGHLLKKAGYSTCIGGKWQLKGDGMNAPKQFGFDEHCLWQLTRRPSRYPNPGLEINGKEVDYSDGEYGPDVVSDFLCDFISRHKDGPFLVYYPMIPPHWPFEPTPDSEDWAPKAEGVLKGVGKNKYFDDMVTYTDKMVGKIVQRLDELKIADNTIVLFTGDNGTYKQIKSVLNGNQMYGAKGSTIDAGTHVPFIVGGPGVPHGQVCNDLVDFSDFLPTLVELAGASAEKNTKLDGRSFAPQLRGEPGNPRDYIYCWYERNGKRAKASQHVRTATMKLYATGKFFNTEADPLELKPLDPEALEPGTKAAYRRLRFALAEHLRVTEEETKRRKRQPKIAR